MKKRRSSRNRLAQDDLTPEYRFDYPHSRPNRFSRREEIEAAALKLDRKSRAKLAERLLESLEQLSDEGNARLWAEEAERRDREWDARSGVAKPAREVLRKARAKLK
jgi:hypothetical protein